MYTRYADSSTEKVVYEFLSCHGTVLFWLARFGKGIDIESPVVVNKVTTSVFDHSRWLEGRSFQG